MSTVIFFLILGFFYFGHCLDSRGWMIVHGGTRKSTPELPLPNGRIIGGKK